jgi:RNA polymerase-associated protein
MTLFSTPDDLWSHRTRIVIAEKAIEIENVDVAAGKYPEDLLDLNPYHTTPTLIDRDLVLYDSRVIMEYLDERFPHPPLMPVDPVSRARARLALYQIEHDWYDVARKIDAAGQKDSGHKDPGHKDIGQLRKVLRDNVLASADLFKVKPFFLSDEFSMVDATIAPILWRLPRYEIDLPPQAQPILKYASAIFSRPAFRASLSETEREMRLA